MKLGSQELQILQIWIGLKYLIFQPYYRELRITSGYIVGRVQQKTMQGLVLLWKALKGFHHYLQISTEKFKEALSKNYLKVIHVLKYDEVVEPVSFHLNEEMIMDYCIGYDLLNNTEILVPAPLTIFRYTPSPPSINPYSFFHTNGLASGNVIEEAICHALCEVVERDAVSLAEFTSSAFQYHILKTVENSLIKRGFQLKPFDSKNFMDDDSIYPEIDLNSIEHGPIKRVVNRFRSSQIPLTVKDITSNLGIPTFIASSAEWVNHEYGYLVEGHGTHPDARIALMRAITEVSQSRAANIQGSRDDLRKMKYDTENSDENRSWQFIKSKEKKSFSDVQTFTYDDILDDIKLILNRLKARGLKKAIVVNLTNSKLNIPVIRVIVPGLETFKINKAVIGQRAKESVKKWLGPNL